MVHRIDEEAAFPLGSLGHGIWRGPFEGASHMDAVVYRMLTPATACALAGHAAIGWTAR
jgi:hypothetical protein